MVNELHFYNLNCNLIKNHPWYKDGSYRDINTTVDFMIGDHTTVPLKFGDDIPNIPNSSNYYIMIFVKIAY